MDATTNVSLVFTEGDIYTSVNLCSAMGGMKTHQTLEMSMMVHICHPNYEHQEVVFIQHGFADVLYSPPPVDTSH